MDYNTTTDGANIVINNGCYSNEYSYRKTYEEDLRRRQAEHLARVYNYQDQNWRPCMHDSCPECLGTGIKSDGSYCMHYLSCPCPKCSPHC